ncbi:hypothetical protein SLS62_001438 [Diatrype stigma]|uniref:Roadblock/LAMTOR2 domain-containing protein n=1 Tax=Diatrype stigma TaxID=117547 RepID=A0AAN9V010_9PEZI
MADKSLPSANAESIEEALRRLSKKPGVKAWLMLDRSTGAVLKTNGRIASVRPARGGNSSSSSSSNNNNNDGNGGSNNNNNTNNNGNGNGNGNDSNNGGTTPFPSDANAGGGGANTETQAAQELAAMIWSFLGTAGGLVGEVDADDELKLLRLRTKKQEFVVVPEHKYLMVVIHDTPPV